MQITDITVALKVFNKIEDARDKLRTEYNEQDNKLKEVQEQVEAYMLEELKRQGLSAIEVPGQGLAKIITKRHFGGGDWGVFWNWLVANNRPDMLQKRLLDSAVAVYLEATGELPPGVNSRAELSINVTKRPK